MSMWFHELLHQLVILYKDYIENIFLYIHEMYQFEQYYTIPKIWARWTVKNNSYINNDNTKN